MKGLKRLGDVRNVVLVLKDGLRAIVLCVVETIVEEDYGLTPVC